MIIIFYRSIKFLILFIKKVTVEKKMKIAHISDLHLGKTLHGFSLIEDQKFILDEIVKILAEKKVDVLLICGDIYDKNIASVEGIMLLRKFLNSLVEKKIKVLLISGNHDSAERLTFGAEFMSEKGIYFSRIYDGTVEKITLSDEFGNVNFYLLPFIKPQIVRHCFPEENIESYDDAVRCAVEHCKKDNNFNKNERNVILAHQNIMSAKRCESEEISIGGQDSVNVDIFKDFDYVALGHIHRPQKIANAVYCGTPLKYSVSELNDEKNLPILDFGKKTEEKFLFSTEKPALKPLREIRQIRGNLNEILFRAKDDPYNPEDFIDVILTDENECLDAMAQLKKAYKNTLRISFDNLNTQNLLKAEKFERLNLNNPLEIFEKFYESRRNAKMDSEQKKYIQNLVDEIWGEN